MINDKAILVGVDGSHASYKATWWAANYAKHAGLTLQIVCAYSLPSYAAVSFDATYTAMGDDNAAHSDAQEILSKAKAIADEQGVECSLLNVCPPSNRDESRMRLYMSDVHSCILFAKVRVVLHFAKVNEGKLDVRKIYTWKA